MTVPETSPGVGVTSPGEPGPDRSRLRLGTAPDSWGVWHPDDPRQVDWTRYLDEASRAGYTRTELGPYGYLPTDPARLRDELERRGLTLTGGTIIPALHRGAAALDDARRAAADEAATLVPLGARFVVVLPDGFTDENGRVTSSTVLSPAEWDALTGGLNALGATLRDEHGLELVFHSHAATHVESQDDIVRLLDATDPALVGICLDTGHVTWGGGDNLALITRYGDRVRYVHLKQVDPVVRQRAIDERLGFAPAVRLGAMVEPPTGEPDMPPILDALAALERDTLCIVEQDLFPCRPDVPYPIADRTRAYYEGLGLDVRGGRAGTAAATPGAASDGGPLTGSSSPAR